MISLIIPALNAEKTIRNLLNSIYQQTVIPDEILIADSQSGDSTLEILKSFPDIRITNIRRSEFDHGKTRDLMVKHSKGDIIIFMTQDAIPADDDSISNLIQPLKDQNIAVSYGRQLPRPEASTSECLIRSFNYPGTSHVYSKKDIPLHGIKTFFCSDVFAAYQKSVYQELGGFEYPIRTNEDMLFAAKAIQSGYSVAYAADARVIHSHNFSFREEYQRNYIQGYELEKHKELLSHENASSEGMKLFRYVSGALWKQGKIFEWFRFTGDCASRYLGNRAGRKDAENEMTRSSDV